MAKIGSRSDGIKKVSKFVTEDGVEHLTHQAAQKHRTRMVFIKWCNENLRINHHDVDVDSILNQIYENWHVTKRSSNEKTRVGEVGS